MPRPLIVLAFLALGAASADAQPGGIKGALPSAPKLPKGFVERADLRVEIVPPNAKVKETVTVRFTIIPKDGAWTYPAFPKDKEQFRNDIIAPAPSDLVFIGPITDPPVEWKEKQRQGGKPGELDQYTGKEITWELKAVVSPKAKPGPKELTLNTFRLQVCNDEKCVTLNGEKIPPKEFRVEEGEGKVNEADLKEALKVLDGAQPAPPQPPAPPGPEAAPTRTADGALAKPVAAEVLAPKSGSRKAAKTPAAYSDELLKTVLPSIVVADDADTTPEARKDKGGLWAFVLTAAAWGLISLVTPCVFPMIPITVSIFMKQADGSMRQRLKLAGVYSLTIITVLGLSAFALLKFMAWLSVHPVTNLLLAALFVVLALSLFGMYELTLPNALQRRLQSKQSQGGVVGTIFGALAFTVISFTCVAPFLGGFAGISAGNEGGGSLISVPTWKEVAGGLAFATAFAAPFFVLALVPGLMKALPKSGGWLDSVKVVMGFLELAAALKFLRAAELPVFSPTQYFTFDLVLGGWVAISAACGLYLLNVYRLPHDEEKPNIGVPRLLFALMFLGLALYLAPALLKTSEGKAQRPGGVVYAWVEAFLLPETEPWPTDLKDAVARSKGNGRPVFVDFTGVNCSNCKYNEEHVFARPEFRARFDEFEKVQLYTDVVPGTAYLVDPGENARAAEARTNGKFQDELFGEITLPMYAVFMPQPDGKLKLVSKFDKGKINDPAEFAAFLDGAREKVKPPAK